MLTDAEVITALIAAIVALFTTAITIIVALFTTKITLKEQRDAASRQQREQRDAASRQQRHELALRAVSYFDEGSQRRNVGISSLEPLWDDNEFEPYWNAWLSLYYGAVVYVLSEGKNRTKAHELLNVSRMVDRLLEKKFFEKKHRCNDVIQAMKSFRDEATDEDKNRGDLRAVFVTDLIPSWIEKIDKQFKELGSHPFKELGSHPSSGT